jgi:hypothetical protein
MAHPAASLVLSPTHLAAEAEAHNAQVWRPVRHHIRQPGRQLRDPRGVVVRRGVVAAAQRQRVKANELVDGRQSAVVAPDDGPADV